MPETHIVRQVKQFIDSAFTDHLRCEMHADNGWVCETGMSLKQLCNIAV